MKNKGGCKNWLNCFLSWGCFLVILVGQTGKEKSSSNSQVSKTLVFIQFSSVHFSHLVMSNSLRPHRLQPTRLLHPWDFPGKNTGVDCHFFLQGDLLNLGIEPGSPTLQADALSSEPHLSLLSLKQLGIVLESLSEALKMKYYPKGQQTRERHYLPLNPAPQALSSSPEKQPDLPISYASFGDILYRIKQKTLLPPFLYRWQHTKCIASYFIILVNNVS